MTMSQLQEEVFELAVSKRKDLKMFCVDLFKRNCELGDDYKILDIGLEKAAEKIIDDTLYWRGDFSVVTSQQDSSN